jgi:hypothetical protein
MRYIVNLSCPNFRFPIPFRRSEPNEGLILGLEVLIKLKMGRGTLFLLSLLPLLAAGSTIPVGKQARLLKPYYTRGEWTLMAN